MQPLHWFVLALAVLVIALVIRGLRIVQQAEVVIIERLGKYHTTLTSGINIIWPFFDKPRKIVWRFLVPGAGGETSTYVLREMDRIDLRETVYDFPRQNVITADNVLIEINALLYFQITDPIKAVYEINNLPDAIEKLTQTSLRNIIGELTLDQTLTSRDTINQKLRILLDEATDKWGVRINRVELQDIMPPPDIRIAMEKQMRAERDRRAVILEAEGQKRAVILQAEGKREAQIAEAEGSKQSEILRADGEAAAIQRVANAEAEAIRAITKAVGEGGADPTKYLIALKYLETLKQIAGNTTNKVVFLPFEATGVLSSLGGIKELLQEKV
ncbi:MAG: SPFH/Band 7/PHB domain protein [candidate division KSB1 bacterium]|nr:SPFH/Band 7/PHB domain protein [candidate division KSB1 bacterium]MDZ7274815.1 SPFH/Band 7/PHB domain protein [candidate division KSB1 bacterium]MDZ7285640.1 SPFH/Band 7/PHB domain protein [candidate division KSB1 bacterium]MDZ7298672.1 SPFH/Band 7/PHB domain protein [candidate division KSB1 bacterium]MDZ7308789.1 SPFH/Band 7/PHB domain protein [candidate division KSB1 bacterium]